MAKTEQLLRMGASHGIPCITIKSLIAHLIEHSVLPAVQTQPAQALPLPGQRGAEAAATVPASRLQCPDGSEAVVATFGAVQQGRPRVRLVEVRA